MTMPEETTWQEACARVTKAHTEIAEVMARRHAGEDPAVIGALWDAAMTALHTAENEVASLHRASRGLRKQRGT